jgi:hypothetical protein
MEHPASLCPLEFLVYQVQDCHDVEEDIVVLMEEEQ